MHRVKGVRLPNGPPMNRRKFLKWLGIAPVAATVAIHLPVQEAVEFSIPTFGQYSDYANFSESAILGSSLDPEVEQAAIELGLSAARTYNLMWDNILNTSTGC